MKVSEVLIEARALIEDERSWTQGAYYRDAEGVDFADYRGSTPLMPTQYCSAGAVRWAAGCDSPTEVDSKTLLAAYKLLKRSARDTGRLSAGSWETVVAYNDAATHEQVLAVFDAAIAAAGTSEQGG